MTIMASARNRYYLQTLGITLWQARYASPPSECVADIAAAPVEPENDAVTNRVTTGVEGDVLIANEAAVANASVAAVSTEDDLHTQLQRLGAQVASCTQCELYQNRKQAVFGVGNPLADWMIIGEAPGAEEDRLGQPFVGRAGKLLDKMLAAIQLDRQSAYIANIIKCRPANNRDPRPEEIHQCLGFLQQQIAIMRPKMILLVGRIAAQTLLESTLPIGKLRGKVYQYQPYGIPMVVTYHPAYLLRSPTEKQKSWQDLILARSSYRVS